ncbi:MAG: alpha/beta fold hydrolase [Pseudomonadota bacterium]
MNAMKWFVKINSDVVAPVRVLCFPSSGGGANVYRPWENQLENVEIYSAQLPGRERRLREPPIESLSALIDCILKEVVALSDKPLILFGHSMGALIAYELAIAMTKRRYRLPVHLIVSAFRSPEKISKSKKLHPLSFDDFIEEIKNYGGTPPQILENRETMELFMPGIRADFKLHETYVFPGNAPLDIPITTFSGGTDHIVPGSNMIGWNNHTTMNYEHHIIQGGHFFVKENPRLIFSVMQDVINNVIAEEMFASL